MLEILEFTFASGWRFAGVTLLLLLVLIGVHATVESVCHAVRVKGGR